MRNLIGSGTVNNFLHLVTDREVWLFQDGRNLFLATQRRTNGKMVCVNQTVSVEVVTIDSDSYTVYTN